MPKPATKKTQSFDTIATRDLWGAASRSDIEGLKKALSRNANPNDQKKVNSWSPPSTPLLKAVEMDFAEGVELLVKRGARRRSSGKDSGSAFSAAVFCLSENAFSALDKALGAMTQPEILECFVALTGRVRTSKKEEVFIIQWSDKIIENLCRHNVKMSPKTTVAICMELLGGNGQFATPHVEVVKRLIEEGLIAPKGLASASTMEGLQEWGHQLGSRKWNDETLEVINVLHELGFPFGAASDVASEPGVKQWLLQQKAEQEQKALQGDTPQARPSAHRMRL